MPERTAVQKKTVNSAIFSIVNWGDKIVSLLSGLLAISLIMYSGWVLYDTFSINQNAANAWEAIKPSIIEDIQNGKVPTSSAGIDFSSIISGDYRAWLSIYDEKTEKSFIDYPVVQGPDNLYYASHDVQGQTSISGAIYLASENDGNFEDSYNLVYGHHMEGNLMFGALDKYVTKSAGHINGLNRANYDARQEGILVSRDAVYDLKIIAVVRTHAYENSIYNGKNSNNNVLRFISNPGDGTETYVYEKDIAEAAEKIVALSTCADADTNGRLVVFYAMEKRIPLTVDADGYDGVYDGTPHSPEAVPNVPDGTTITYEYSEDGGKTWIPSDEPPALTDVGTIQVKIIGENPENGKTEKIITINVTPRPVTVTVNNGIKTSGEDDPVYTATVTGLVGGDTIDYTIKNNAPSDEVGDYPGAIVANGAANQGNYVITYTAGDLKVVPPGAFEIATTDTDITYDGQPHTPEVVTNVPDGTTIEYSTDGGKTWTKEVPSFTNVGTYPIEVRATNPDYGTITDTVTIKINPKEVVVRVDNASKYPGQADPAEFTATVTGLIGNDTVVYTIVRNNVGTDEGIGFYPGAIVATGDEIQGNYKVTYVAGDFRINDPDEPEPEDPGNADVPPVNPGGNNNPPVNPGGNDNPVNPGGNDNPGGNNNPEDPITIDPEPTPLARFIAQFTPQGASYSGNNCWAIINLICVIVTLYLFLPITNIKAKFQRGKLMKRINEEKETLQNLEKSKLEARLAMEQDIINQTAVESRGEGADKDASVTDEEFTDAVEKLFYKVKTFVRRARIGTGFEILLSILSVVTFILTENITMPMVIIDRWTPLMIVILAMTWVVDVRLIRYREGNLSEEERKLREQIERLETAGA